MVRGHTCPRERREERWWKERKQSQKRYMVSGSLCPLLSILDVSFSVSFVVRGQGLSKGRRGLAGGLEQGSWGLGRVSKGLGGWGLDRAEGLGSGGA